MLLITCLLFSCCVQAFVNYLVEQGRKKSTNSKEICEWKNLKVYIQLLLLQNFNVYLFST